MSSKRYPEEFKVEAVKQITERGHSVADMAGRIGVSQHSLYAWVKQYSLPGPVSANLSASSLYAWVKQYSLPAEARQEQQSQSVEIRQLKTELKHVTEERDIIKKAAAYFAKESR